MPFVQIMLDPDYLSDCLAVSYDYDIKNLYSKINYVQRNSVSYLLVSRTLLCCILPFVDNTLKLGTVFFGIVFKTQIENSIQVWKCHLQC